jgi:polar amino acid transport system substrate-binding protein
MLKRSIFFAIFLLFCLTGCEEKKIGPYEIAFDPIWYPLNFTQKENAISGFSTELLTAISKEERLILSLLSTNWDSLFFGLQNKQYQAVLSSLQPYNFNTNTYDFSECYLPLGPVLVLPANSPYASLSDIQGKEIGALTKSASILILESYPEILIQTYDTIPDIFNALLSGQISGALVPILSAQSYTQGSFQSELKIASSPLNEEGLRLITLKGQAPELIKRFNKGLEKIQKQGQYKPLLEHWGFSEQN